MAVQQNKKSPSKRGMHRSHDFLTNPPLAVEPTTGEVHLRHHISPNGYYRGKKVVKTKGDSGEARLWLRRRAAETDEPITCFDGRERLRRPPGRAHGIAW